jgi:superoxide dismutase
LVGQGEAGWIGTQRGLLAWEPFAPQLLVVQAEKHQNQAPSSVEPILALDVWEHACYVRYRNRRADYVNAWWNVVNWPHVSRHFDAVSREQVAFAAPQSRVAGARQSAVTSPGRRRPAR